MSFLNSATSLTIIKEKERERERERERKREREREGEEGERDIYIVYGGLQWVQIYPKCAMDDFFSTRVLIV